jgi:disulfide bond formation protein DsbB
MNQKIKTIQEMQVLIPVLGVLLLLATPGLASQGPSIYTDFNGDGLADLAIGVPFEDVGSVVNAGAVNVLYGTATGLSATGNQFWTQNSPDILDTSEEGDLFGSTLAAADFNGDGFADLAIGVSAEAVGTVQKRAGAVNVLYGMASGLSATGNQFWTQDSPDIPDSAQYDDRFGITLTTGDFNGDGFADLAIGVPGEDLTIHDETEEGLVHVLYGSTSGLSATGNQVWTQDSPDILDTSEAGDSFGGSLASGDFNGDGFADLAIGALRDEGGGPSTCSTARPGGCPPRATSSGPRTAQISRGPSNWKTHSGGRWPPATSTVTASRTWPLECLGKTPRPAPGLKS